MKIINPSVELMRSGLETEMILPEQFIEKVGRTCYKSEDKITEDSAAKFVSGLVKRGHEAMIEHWNLIFQTDVVWYENVMDDWDMLLNPFLTSSLTSSNLRRVSLRDAIGVTVFIISCVRTLISLDYDCCSFSAISLLMSLNAMILTVSLPIVASEAVRDMVILPLSL